LRTVRCAGRGFGGMSVQAVIFSKDRALQLHATLASFRLQCSEAADIPIAVVFRSSESEFQKGYNTLGRELAGELQVTWVEESDFKKNLLSALTAPSRGEHRWWERFWPRQLEPRYDHILFMVDDNIFVRNFSSFAAVHVLETNSNALGFSLRLGRNTGYCYSNRCPQEFPEFCEHGEGILGFEWVKQQGDFGYPLEVSSSLYRTPDLLPLLRKLPYNNPNRLEQGLSVSRMLLARRRPDLLCFDQSVAFCAPVNKVQSVVDNRAGKNEAYSSERLNDLFLQGYRIDVEALSGFVPDAAHQEIELPLVKRSA
jgi:hypothetical protein